jgi:hypothetical protein
VRKVQEEWSDKYNYIGEENEDKNSEEMRTDVLELDCEHRK